LEIKEPLDKKGERGYNLQSPNVLGEEWKKVRISIGELKRDLSGVINQAAYGKERIVIVSRGKPKAAMIGMEDLARQLWETWTADERLYNSVKDGFPFIHWLGERGKVP